MRDYYLTLAIIDAHIAQPATLRVVADVRSLVRYDAEDPVIIRERRCRRSTWLQFFAPEVSS